METLSGSRISLKQAGSLGLLVFAVYFPIILYVHLPKDAYSGRLIFLLFPAILNLVFYVFFILGADRLIERVEQIMGERFLLKSPVPAVVLSIPVAIIALFLLQSIFEFSISIIRALNAFVDDSVQPVAFDAVRLAYVKRINNGLNFVILLSISYLLINRKAMIKMKSLEVEAQQLVNENTLAQYEALKNQVSPHFLFNSLSILSSLVHIDPYLSEQFIDKLSKAYRYILEQKDNDTVSLSTELDFIAAYTFLLRIRFDNKFNLLQSITKEDAEKYQVAPLTLQLLVENAVKHNRMSAKEPLTVKVYREQDYLVIENATRPRNEQGGIASTGIGLNNIVHRYKLLTATPVLIDKNQKKFRVNIPLIV